VGDATVCDGKISAGSSNVFIGGGTDTTDDISPDVPGWLHRAMFVVGGGGCCAGWAGGGDSGYGGWVCRGLYRLQNWRQVIWGGERWAEAIGVRGALLGGALGAKGGRWFDARYEVQAKGLGSNLGNINVAKKTGLSSAKNLGDITSGRKISDVAPSALEKQTYKRGSFRKGVREKVWKTAVDDSPDGIVRDPLTKLEMKPDEPWDMGHKPGYENWKHVRSSVERRISRKEFLDEYNDVSHYRSEPPSSNRSHADEIKTSDYFGP
jgi:hypothetical protein